MAKLPGEYSNRVVAYVDALGFKELVKASRNNPIKQNELYQALMRLEREQKREFEVSTFSDHIVGSMAPDHVNLHRLFHSVVDFSMALIANMGIFVRGAITVGPLTHDKKIIFGPALVEAFEIEHEIAIYPRIVIAENVPIPEAIMPGIMRSNDDVLYIDLFWPGWALSCNAPGERLWRDEELAKIHDQITSRLGEVRNPKAHGKLAWFASYFNKALERYGEKETKRIGESEIRLSKDSTVANISSQ